MGQPLYRSRPGGFQIEAASMPLARCIEKGIYVSEGLSNSYLINTSEGRIIVNTGMGFEAPIHRRNYDAVDDGPIRYILLTQGHVDHVGGVDLFLEAGTEVVAQAGNAAHQADDERIAQFRAARSAFAFSKVINRSLPLYPSAKWSRDEWPIKARANDHLRRPIDARARRRATRAACRTGWRDARFYGDLDAGSTNLLCR